ncbi:MAG: CAP domain-containing protein [Myxococcales bacterium]|nr:CAP domain-containing protein [Myxococcales bacterium]
MFVALLTVLTLHAPTVDSVGAWLSAHGWGRPARSAALDAVAADLAARLAGPVGEPPPAGGRAHLDFLLAEAGITDARVEALTVRHRDAGGFEARLPGLLGRLDRRQPPTHLGLATRAADGALTSTVVLVHRGATLDAPLPRRAAPDTTVAVRGALRRGYFAPRVLVAPPRGPVREQPARTPSRRLDATVAFDAGPGVYGVEVVADSAAGPVVLHNARVYVGVAPPALPVVRVGPASDGAAPAEALATLIARFRQSRGLRPLAWHPALADIARAHARDLARAGTLAHTLPDTGSLVTRVRARGLHARWVAENLAVADDPGAALAAFLRSPGHARNLALPGLSHLGIGVAGRYYVVALVGAPQ